MTLKKLVDFPLDYAPQCHITKYLCPRTKLQLVHVNYKSSPLVQGYFAVATECINDSGAPHTLEHLIFMGSKNYPYKGILDTLGNQCMSYTNAWTATDQTVYTLVTAGWKGFQKLLPVYLEHVLEPTITDAACTTEVYHLDPDQLTGKGVVYSEMEAIETQSWFVTSLEKQRQMFPRGSGYRSETGGLTANLKVLTNDEIRQFHRDMYRSDNLCLIICGNVPEDELLKTVNEWNDTLPDALPGTKKPFVDNPLSQIPPRRTELIETTVEFPEQDESQSELLFSWTGKAYTDYQNDLAVSILMDYLTETSLAPFVSGLVELEDPLSNSVEHWSEDFMRTIVNLAVHGVPTEKLAEAKAKVLDILATHTIDLKRMKQVIDTYKCDYVFRCESTPEAALSSMIITDFIYGSSDGSSLKTLLKDLNDFKALESWSADQWQSLMREVLVENKPVIVIGKPSSELDARITKEKADEVATRKATLTEADIAKLREKLESAKAANAIPAPSELLAKFEMKEPAKTVEFIQPKSIVANGPLLPSGSGDGNGDVDELTESILRTKPENFPLFLYLQHFPSQFVELHCLLDSTHIKDVSLLPYYHIFNELFSMPMSFNSPDGKVEVMPFEDVVAKLKAETMESEISIGLQGQGTDLVDFKLRFKASEYAKAVQWIKHCLFDMVFDEKRVSVLLENYLNSIVELKREGSIMLTSLGNRNLFTERSLSKSTDPLFVEDILGEVMEQIEDGKYADNVLPKLETVRDELRRNFDRISLLVLGDMTKIGPDVYSPWEPLIQQIAKYSPNLTFKQPVLPRSLDSISEVCAHPSGKAFIIVTPASESSYMRVYTSIPFNLNFDHPDFAPVSLASEYLQCVEGPFWKGIRGSGLAYGASMRKQPEINSWAFNIYRGADIIKCYTTGKQIIDDYASGALPFDPQLVRGAVSSLINNMATKENGYIPASIANFTNVFLLGRGADFNTRFLERLNRVTVEDLQRVMKEYLANLFNVTKNNVFVSCHPSKLDAIRDFLEAQGLDVSIEELQDDDSEDEEEELRDNAN